MTDYMAMPVSISIHAPRKGSDLEMVFKEGADYISIHAPRKGSDRRLHSSL